MTSKGRCSSLAGEQRNKGDDLIATKKPQVTWAEAEKSPNELTIIENLAGDLQRHGFIPMAVFITEKQHADIIRLKMNLTSCLQASLNDDIAIFAALAKAEEEEESGIAGLGALFG